MKWIVFVEDLGSVSNLHPEAEWSGVKHLNCKLAPAIHTSARRAKQAPQHNTDKTENVTSFLFFRGRQPLVVHLFRMGLRDMIG